MFFIYDFNTKIMRIALTIKKIDRAIKNAFSNYILTRQKKSQLFQVNTDFL